MLDFATRAYNHSFHIDPIIRSLLDLDMYKLLMHKFIKQHRIGTPVTYSLINRTKTVRLADIIPIDELRAQLDHARNLRFTNNELIWLQGNTFYGTKNIFCNDFIEFLRNYKLPSYELGVMNGQYELTFSGAWEDIELWETIALAILGELRTRQVLKTMTKFELDILYARAKNKLWEKLKTLKAAGVTGIAEFGTRRRHSFLWQEWAINCGQEVLGSSLIGTSNTYLAMKHGLEAIGTNAHSLYMVEATFANSPAELVQSQYNVMKLWEKTYGSRLLVMLGDAYGTTQFLKNAPDFVANWIGARLDSKDPISGGEEYISWWKSRGQNPQEKLLLPSDGLDVAEIIKFKNHFNGRCRIGYGWGTTFSNDFRDCHPKDNKDLDPISLVCKVTAANGRPAVKLSDNFTKATGDAATVEYYRKVFGTEGVENAPVIV